MVIQELAMEMQSVSLLCDTLGVSRSAYYVWRQDRCGVRALRMRTRAPPRATAMATTSTPPRATEQRLADPAGATTRTLQASSSTSPRRSGRARITSRAPARAGPPDAS